MSDIILYENSRAKIITLRDQRVLLDRDLAELYGVETKVLNQAVKRNIERFPGDFMFQLNEDELKNLMSQIVTSSLRSQIVILNNDKNGALKQGKHIKYLPYAFTEQGIAMLSSVLRSKKAININIIIMRVFVMVARIIDSSKTLDEKIEDIKKEHQKSSQEIKKHDNNIKEIFDIIKALTEKKKEDNNKPEIGFKYKK